MIFTVDGSRDDDNDVERTFGRSIEINFLILRLNKEFPNINDVGIVAAFIFDCFRLKPNEGMFLKPNLPRAYFSGDCFECMTCSDNVVCVGSTPKLRDTSGLCQIVDYVTQEPSVFNGQVSPNKTLTSYYLCSPCLCYSLFGLVSDSDIIGGAFFVIVSHLSRNIIEVILISKWCNQSIDILHEERKRYDGANNDNENYEHGNNENRQNKAIPIILYIIDDGSNDIEDVHANYINNKEETRNNSTKGTVSQI